MRIIAATHQNLEERVRQGLFREDLMHRLNVVRLRLPPLRERREDIAPLARHFLQKSARDLAVEPKSLSEDALKALSAFAFPGNVRQLENICHWLTVMAPGQRVDVADLPPEVRAAAGDRARRCAARPDWQHALDRELAQALARGERNVGDRLEQEFERTLILRALAHTGGHRMEAAQWLGWGRNTLTRKIQELGLEAELRKAPVDGRIRSDKSFRPLSSLGDTSPVHSPAPGLGSLGRRRGSGRGGSNRRRRALGRGPPRRLRVFGYPASSSAVFHCASEDPRRRPLATCSTGARKAAVTLVQLSAPPALSTLTVAKGTPRRLSRASAWVHTSPQLNEYERDGKRSCACRAATACRCPR